MLKVTVQPNLATITAIPKPSETVIDLLDTALKLDRETYLKHVQTIERIRAFNMSMEYYGL